MRPIDKPAIYNLSFTAASLRPELARIVAESYLATGDWNLAKDHILASNSLQYRSASGAIRLERELRQRLQTLTHDQIVLVAQATAEDRASISWLAACKHIRFAFEFAAEVLRDKLAARDPVLRPSDYETYVESKGVSQPEIARLATSSKNKIRQVLLRMLLEAGLLRCRDRLRGHSATSPFARSHSLHHVGQPGVAGRVSRSRNRNAQPLNAMNIHDLSERLFKTLSHPSFLTMKGLANEVPIFIQTYEPEKEDHQATG